MNFNLKFREGEHFISGGEDKLVKLWGYDEGMLYFIGTGHSGSITKVFNKELLILFRLLSVQTKRQ